MSPSDQPKYGRYAKKRFGQHFLHDRGVCRRIVDGLDIAPGDRVLEIGPGHGAISGLIAEAGPGVYAAVERDTDLVFELPDKCPGVMPLAADAMDIRWERLAPAGGWKLIGNLPYNVASPLMWEIFSRCTAMSRAVFMVQKEVGDRLVARPGTKSYGGLTAWVQSWVQPRVLFTVGPGAFTPRPKVDSSVLVFLPLGAAPAFSPAELAGLVRMCFQKRRKQLGNTLKLIINDESVAFLEGEGLSLRSRPEELTPKQFQTLSMLVKKPFPS